MLFYPFNILFVDTEPFYLFTLPITNIYYLCSLICLSFASIFPDHGLPNSLVKKLFPTVTSPIENLFFFPEKGKHPQKSHREITHPLTYLFPILLLLGIFFVFSVLIVFVFFFYILSSFNPFKEYFHTFGIFNPILLIFSGGAGYIFGLFSHLWLDSTSIEGVWFRDRKKHGFYYVGSEVEECAAVLIFYPILIISIIEFIMLSFHLWEISYLFTVLSLLLFVSYGYILRSKKFSELILPQKICKKNKKGCCDPWFIAKSSRKNELFWGHPDWKTGPCNLTEDLEGSLIDRYSGIKYKGLRLYFKIRPFLIRIKEVLILIYLIFSKRKFQFLLFGAMVVLIHLWYYYQ